MNNHSNITHITSSDSIPNNRISNNLKTTSTTTESTAKSKKISKLFRNQYSSIETPPPPTFSLHIIKNYSGTVNNEPTVYYYPTINHFQYILPQSYFPNYTVSLKYIQEYQNLCIYGTNIHPNIFDKQLAENASVYIPNRISINLAFMTTIDPGETENKILTFSMHLLDNCKFRL